MKVLLLASSSFAASRLDEVLRLSGFEVWTFNRAPQANAGPTDLSGSYEQLTEIVSRSMQQCDVIINFAIVKNGSIEQNIELTDQIIRCVQALKAKRLVHISSVSVLPSLSGTVKEDTPAVDVKWKGIYSRVKSAVEIHLRDSWTEGFHLDIVRPGFILAPGIADTMVGIGRSLPNDQILGLGNRKTVIMVLERDALHEAICKISNSPLSDVPRCQTFMLVSPDAPSREQYLRFHCDQLGRGSSVVHFPPWLWRVGLLAASLPLSILKRKVLRLDKLFAHNINVRRYDCSQTEAALDLDLKFDWRKKLFDISELGRSAQWPAIAGRSAQTPSHLAYYGLGRIVHQKHLPSLKRIGFKGEISWSDPAVKRFSGFPNLRIAEESGVSDLATHAVVTAPLHFRSNVLRSLPRSVRSVLIEKPFAVGSSSLSESQCCVQDRNTYVLHNYRYKKNVLQWRFYLQRYPAGRLRAVTVHFETPSPVNEQASWMKQEWKYRILLTDYAVHLLDIAWLLLDGPMTIDKLIRERNARGELASVASTVSFGDTPCNILIRSGGHQRHCLIRHHFQNYTTELRFFPDVFVCVRGGQTFLDDASLAMKGFAGNLYKVCEKAKLAVGDLSHDRVISEFLGMTSSDTLNELRVDALLGFYKRLAHFADEVYQ